MNTISVGRHYKTKGGWIAFIHALMDNKPTGWCKDPLTGHEEPMMGIWNKYTGKCIKRGNDTNNDITTPYDIINFKTTTMKEKEDFNELEWYKKALYQLIKPCPFCGGTDNVIHVPNNENKEDVTCLKCGAKMTKALGIGVVYCWNQRP